MKACEKDDQSRATGPADATKQGRSVGISLEYTGSPGDVVAFGYNAFESGSNLSAIEFHDLGTLSGKGSVWTGIPIGPTQGLTAGPFQPQIALANFSNTKLTAQLSFWETREKAEPQEQTFTLELPPLSAKTFEVPGLAGSPEMRNSFVATSSGEPGDVVASLVSYNESSGQLVQTLAKDLGQTENAGGHPWTLEGGIDSILLLFNPTSAKVLFNVKIPANGKMWGKAYTLGPGETLKLDLAQLVASQPKDDWGFKLPKDLKGGELSWFNANPAQGFGRIVQTAPSRLLARNFSCGQFIVLCGSYLDVSSVTVGIGSTAFLGAIEPTLCSADFPTACSGNYYSQGGSGYTYSWSAGNPSIASITGSTTSASADFLGNSVGAFSGNGTIATSSCNFGSSGSGSVTPVITGFSPGRGLIGNNITVTITGQGFGSSPTVQVAGSGVTASVGSAGDTKINATFAISGSATAGNHAVTVTNTSVTPNKVSGPQDWFVQTPGVLKRYNVSGAPDGYGPLVVLDPNYGNVVDPNGKILATNQCGAYRNLAYALYDQDTTPQEIYGGYSVTETFSNFSGYGTQPANRTVSIPLNSLVITDNVYLGKTAPNCLGSNDNQTFNQGFSVTVGTKNYPLSFLNTISRGRFSGTYKVDVTIKSN